MTKKHLTQRELDIMEVFWARVIPWLPVIFKS